MHTLVIHGGAGNITPSLMNAQQEASYKSGLKAALDAGYSVLNGGGAALDAVVAAIVALEDNPLFNAGRGSVFTKKGLHEMDAALMNGKDLAAGAVAGVRNIKNPIKLAREVMLHSGHVMLSGKGATEFALKQGIAQEHDDYFFNKDRYDQWVEIRDSDLYQLDHKEDNLKGIIPNTDHKFGTVGAVACDSHGNLAGGTSTGGMTNKRFGRIGDSPVIGAGTYANDKTCATSCTGHGEFFLRAVVAYDVSCLMEYRGLSLKEACDTVIKDKLKTFGGEGGLIAVDAKANHCFSFNSAGMYRAYRSSEGGEAVDFLWRGLDAGLHPLTIPAFSTKGLLFECYTAINGRAIESVFVNTLNSTLLQNGAERRKILQLRSYQPIRNSRFEIRNALTASPARTSTACGTSRLPAAFYL